MDVLLLDSRLLLIKDLGEDLTVIIFVFYLPIAQIDHFSKVGHVISTIKNLLQEVVGLLLKGGADLIGRDVAADDRDRLLRILYVLARLLHGLRWPLLLEDLEVS